jgi:hypothetical protein
MARTSIIPADPDLRDALRLAALFAVFKLALHIATNAWQAHIGWGYFRDELYYILCGQHLAWGYVDHGPVVAVQARLAILFFGKSLVGLRLFSALAGAKQVFLTGLIAWALGGRRAAQSLAMLCVMVAPQYLGVDSFLSMNSFESPFWMSCILIVILMQRAAVTENPKPQWWLVLGAVAGFGLLNKPSMLFFLIALLYGILLTPQRRLLTSWYFLFAVAIVALITMPYLLWQIHNHFPTWEFLRNGQVKNKNVILSPLAFLGAQITQVHPLTIFVWAAGLVSLLRNKSTRGYRWIGFTFLIFLALMMKMHAKDYYVTPIYPMLFAAGGLAWERTFALRGWGKGLIQRNRAFAFPIMQSLLIITGILILPMAIPVMHPQTLVDYSRALHLKGDNTETMKTGPLPQFYADRFGWQEEVDIVAKTFHSLTPQDQQRVCIFGGNYGEAAAIDFLGRLQHDDLPPAMSGQNNYWLWGTHGCDPNLVIAVIHDTPQEVSTKYESVTIVGVRDNPFAMPFEHGNIYLLRNRRSSAPFYWADERFYF